MNDITIEPRRFAPSVWLPYAALLITLAALTWHVPAKLAAFFKGKPAPKTTSSLDLAPTYVNYPLPARSLWFANSDAALLAHR